jgi:molybdopterin-containing oxidoreductase family iron-sulfur binding subunit
VLTGAVTSPTVFRQMAALQQRWPQVRWHAFEPVGQERRHAAARLAFGRTLDLHWRPDRADAIVGLEGDLLGPGPDQLRQAWLWGERRRRGQGAGALPDLLVAESTPSLTGAMAGRRQPAAAARMPALALALAQDLGVDALPEAVDLSLAERGWVAAAAAALRAAGPAGLLAMGPHLPPEVQALGHRINEVIGALGETVVFTEPVTAEAPDGGLEALAGRIAAGGVETLLVLDANPVYTAPADLAFAELMERVPLRLHAGLFYDETAALSHWHLPLSHALESWGDARATDGTATLLQPTVRPFYATRSVPEILAMLGGNLRPDGRAIVQRTWRKIWGLEPGDAFTERWRAALIAGYVPDTAPAPRPVSARPVTVTPPAPGDAEEIELVFRPDPTVWDGRFANCAWLQELPKPYTKLTWATVAAVSPALAAELGLSDGDLVTVGAGDRTVEAPAWVLPGQAARTVAVHLGYGRERAGRVGDGLGFDAYRLRTTGAPWLVRGAILRPADGRLDLPTTQHHFAMEGHHFVQTVTPQQAAAPPAALAEPEEQPSFYERWEYPTYAWAMVIDLDLCIGCNACVIACQAENNVPVVGPEQVAMGREMHWLRVDRYHSGPPDNPHTFFQPVPCMHCEQAPCEVGCPVNATVHGPEGLNQMIYNRCVGTRTCSSYCPYKVRRFNFYDWHADVPPATQAQFNPDVTVRARGVMEKCTYCVQRISRARIEANREDRPIRDGEVETACQSACPTRAIVFGDMNDADTAVAAARRSSREYTLLEHLSTRPRTTYLARILPAPPVPDEEA